MAFGRVWTALRDWAQGELTTPAFFNAQLRDNLAYLGPLAAVEFSSDVSVTGTAFVDVVSSGAITYAATPIEIWFFARALTVGGADGLTLNLRDGATDLGKLSQYGTSSITNGIWHAKRLTPSAGSHTYKISAINLSSQTSTVHAGPGGAGAFMPGFLLVKGAVT